MPSWIGSVRDFDPDKEEWMNYQKRLEIWLDVNKIEQDTSKKSKVYQSTDAGNPNRSSSSLCNRCLGNHDHKTCKYKTIKCFRCFKIVPLSISQWEYLFTGTDHCLIMTAFILEVSSSFHHKYNAILI